MITNNAHFGREADRKKIEECEDGGKRRKTDYVSHVISRKRINGGDTDGTILPRYLQRK